MLNKIKYSSEINCTTISDWGRPWTYPLLFHAISRLVQNVVWDRGNWRSGRWCGTTDTEDCSAKCVFTIEKKQLRFTRAKGNHNSDPWIVKVFHTNMIGVHFWRNGLSLGASMERVDYKWGVYVPLSFPGWTDTIENSPRVSSQDIVYTDKKGNN